mmetsp:Transcript_45449/g.125437  ORF Transcript_45449/g.125437 Transcript_45449/m.125437 type:complete len:235 (+) Transcript_45449:948-1652(+)
MVADVVRNQPPSVWVDGREQVKPRGAARVLLIVLVDIAVKRLPVAGVYARHKYRGDERGERVKAEVEWNAERLQASKANGHGRLARLAREVYVARVGLRIIRQSHIALGINVVGYMQRLVLGELLVRRVHDPPMEAVLELGKDAHGREHQTEPLGNGIGRPDCGDGANEHASCSGTLRSVGRRRRVENWSWCEFGGPSQAASGCGIFWAAAVAVAVARSQWAESGVEVEVPPAR